MLFESFQEKATNRQRVDDFINKPICSISIQETGNIEPMGLATKKEHLLIGEIGVSFWCNSEQYDHALKNAKKSFLNQLFAEQLHIVSELRGAVYAGDGNQLMRLIDEFQKSMGL